MLGCKTWKCLIKQRDLKARSFFVSFVFNKTTATVLELCRPVARKDKTKQNFWDLQVNLPWKQALKDISYTQHLVIFLPIESGTLKESTQFKRCEIQFCGDDTKDQREILGTLGRVPNRSCSPTLPHGGICWYISRVLPQTSPTFPFDNCFSYDNTIYYETYREKHLSKSQDVLRKGISWNFSLL